jgi:hypothetical protein
MIVFNCLHLVKPFTQFLEFVRWNDDDAIIQDYLRMRIANLTQPNFP